MLLLPQPSVLSADPHHAAPWLMISCSSQKQSRQRAGHAWRFLLLLLSDQFKTIPTSGTQLVWLGACFCKRINWGHREGIEGAVCVFGLQNSFIMNLWVSLQAFRGLGGWILTTMTHSDLQLQYYLERQVSVQHMSFIQTRKHNWVLLVTLHFHVGIY